MAGELPLTTGYTELKDSTQTEEALQALLALKSDDALNVFAHFERKRPGILRKALAQLPPTPDPSPRPSYRGHVDQNETGEQNAVPVSEKAPVVQFTSYHYYCKEEEGQMELDLMRAGDLSQPTIVHLRTRDRSAKAGKHYVAVDSQVRFEPGEDNKVAVVPLLTSDEWDTTTEFLVQLHAGDDGPTNATFGRYLWQTRVKRIDSVCFPSNKYEEFVRDGVNVKRAPHFALFWDYVKLNLSNDTVRRRTIWFTLIDLIHNFHEFLQLFVNVYLVDYVLAPDVPGSKLLYVQSKKEWLLLIFAAHVVPFLIVHVLDNVKAAKCGVGGTSRERLQLGLLRKFLNYDPASRSQLGSGDLIMSITRDSMALVADGYKSMLGAVKDIGSLALMLAYQFVAPFVFRKRFSYMPIVTMLLFPLTMSCFLQYRNLGTTLALNSRNKAMDKMVSTVDETAKVLRLLLDYRRREDFIDRFEADVKTFNNANRNAGIVLMNNAYFSRWLSEICVAGWIIWGGYLVLGVIGGDLSLGMFLANINIFRKIGSSWGSIYTSLLRIMTIFPALEHITTNLNRPIEVPRELLLNRSRRKQTKQIRAELKSRPHPDGTLPVDRMPIIVGNLEFTYTTDFGQSATLNLSGIMTLSQGTLAIVTGPSGGGTSTLLKILGGELLPDPSVLNAEHSSRFFVPSHLRVLQVSTPLFFDDTLLKNLTFGCNGGDDDARIDRVVAVCVKLGVDEEVIRHIKSDKQSNWIYNLSSAQCQLLSIARAFVANPEVVCLHKPTQLFEPELALKVMMVFKEHVVERGLVQVASSSTRRPRTLIMSTKLLSNFHLADQVFHVSQSGIYEVPRSEYASTYDIVFI